MREILFRGKRLDDGKWVKGCYVYDESGQITEKPTAYIHHTHRHPSGWNLIPFKVIPETVGQYTGLTDKNGKEIFEGDILIITDDDGDIEFSDGGIGNVVFECGMWYIAGNPQNSLYDLSRIYYIEVTGNIHDNPELLGGKQ